MDRPLWCFICPWKADYYGQREQEDTCNYITHVSGTVEEISADIKDVKVVVASLTYSSTMNLCWEASGQGDGCCSLIGFCCLPIGAPAQFTPEQTNPTLVFNAQLLASY